MVLMAAAIVVAAGAPVTALATSLEDIQEVNLDTERNNEVEQGQISCANDVDISTEGDQIALVDADQTNDCLVVQDQNAVIWDDSEESLNLQTVLAEIGYS